MKTWTDWEVVRHHVSICGRVINSDGASRPGIQLTLVPQGKESKSTFESSARSRRGATKAYKDPSNALKQIESRQDGVFFFLDCSDGKYILKALDTRSGNQAEQTVVVAENAMEKFVKNRTREEGYQIEIVM